MTAGLSIGYGAMQPASTPCKVFATIYIIVGAYGLTLLLAVFVRKLMNLIPRIAAEEWQYQVKVKAMQEATFDQQSANRAWFGCSRGLNPRYKVELGLWFALFCWTLLGIVWAHEWQPSMNGRHHWSWATSVFFAVGTITTTGMVGPKVDEEGKVPSQTATFLAIYALVGVPLFGAAVSHRAATYVEAQLRHQERENFGNRLSIDLFNAVRELRYGAAAARRSTRNSRFGLEPRNSITGLRRPAPTASPRPSTLAMPVPATIAGGSSSGQRQLGQTPVAQAPSASPGTMDRNTNKERVLWGDFLALQLIRLRKVDFELLKDLREEYLEMIAASQESGGVSWSMLVPVLTGSPEGDDVTRSERSADFFTSATENLAQDRQDH